MSENQSYQRISKSVSGLLDDELVMMDIEKGKYFALNMVATRIWNVLENPHTISSICEKMLDEYEVEPDECKRDVTALLKEMEKLGLVSKM